ncbi:PQQ-dependent sugar dehydrogenase [Deinococcus deserti]|uniref:Putative L-sorbosone dehydrogenase n=1 Tax=Deinococcus deserti (strain DSM 17065 / CIP 109153 / LMG 22923 / VCD115) TaxID=546414 RepID=C1D1P9_DEIDV|nr:sorbosone dehydrogenase family protein [Deinococcus deserti]ACO45773.1 putative L-sorbosone dehydrogenase [Deinococcus deserti VCD115]
MLRVLLIAALALGPAVPAGAQAPALKLPAGFTATTYAEGFEKPRFMVVASNGDVLLSDTSAGLVYLLPDRNSDGRADSRLVYARGLNQPHGLAIRGGYLYVANTDSVVRFAYKAGDRQASGAPQKVVSLPGGGGHSTRTIEFGPDGRMYVSVGSTCNVCEEEDPKRAAVWVYDSDGKNGRPYATGLRNAVGLEWFGGQLFATNNGRDQLGDDIPPESFFKLRAGGFYGWPYCYTVRAGQAQVWDRDFGRKTASTCKTAVPAFALTTAHSAPLGLAFYTGKTFPAAYRGQMFAALHGSWNRSEKSGYKVVAVDPKTGKVTDFLTGFLRGEQVSGRPVDLAVARDGALLLSDDGAGKVWRIQYGK